MNERLMQQLNFLHEIDKLKTVFRQTNLISETSRYENSAEHSWHFAFYALVLQEYANEEINLLRVIKMALLHDLVEIDAGDTFCYDVAAHKEKEENELKAAKRLFGMLPPEQEEELMSLWLEFEEGQSADAKFAISLDRIQPLLHNVVTGGGSWTRHGINRTQVEARMAPVAQGSKELACLVDDLLDQSVKKGILKPKQ
jgi:putative hydrolase of HD superfamily